MTGSFPCLRAYIHLERRLRAYVLSTFLPSILIVLLSWVSFWIDLESVPARISLGILTMLTITTQSSVHLRNMPAVSFTKAEWAGAASWCLLDNSRILQLADYQLADWTTRGLDISRTGQLAD